MSLEINSNEVQSITRNNKRVVLIVKNSDGSVIYDVGGISSIILTATSQSLCYVDNESATLTASVYDDNDEAVTGQTVELYDSNDNLITTMTDNDDGTYTYTYTPSTSGVVTFYAKVSGKKSNDLVISSSKRATDITFTASSNSVVYSNSITLSGTLKHNNTGLSSASVKIYDGNTLIDTVTVTDGAFSKTISDLGVGSHTFSAVYDGDTNYNDAISSNVSVTITQHGTILNINVPTTLVYSDEFNITGTLTDGTNVIAGATVNLLVGSTVVDSDTTDSNGQVSFTQTPVSMGTHSFQLSYAGTTNYSGATSSTVTRDITKETSVLTVTNPSNSSSTMYSDGTLEVTGSLVTDDGEPISGATITIKESTTTLGTATTGSDGGFSKNLSLATGTHNLTIGFATDTYYTASSASKTVVVSDPTISLTVAAYDSNDTQISSASSSAILSYADSEYAVVTATYLGANVSGKTISFDIVDSSTGNVIENIDSVATNSSGVCSVTYQSKHTGDLYIQATCSNISSTSVKIEDCWFVDGGVTGNKNNSWITVGSVNVQTDSNGTKLSSSVNADQYYKCPQLLSGDFSVEYTLVDGYWIEFDMRIFNSSDSRMFDIVYYTGTGGPYLVINDENYTETKFNYSHSKPVNVKVTRVGSTWTVYENEVQKGTATRTSNDVYFTFLEHHDMNRFTTYKDLKIKPLERQSVVDDVSLTVDKPILSYIDSDTATITATVTNENGGVIGNETVSFDIVDWKGDVIEHLGTGVTDCNGECSVTYQSKGTGDITIQASCNNITSSSVTIEDCYFYDASSSSNLSKYTIPSGASMTYDSTENAYIINYTDNAYGQRAILLNNIPLSRKVTIRCDVKYRSGGNNQIRLGLMNNNIIGGRIGFNYGDCNVMRYPQNSVSGESSLVSQSGVTYSTSEWYTMEMTYNSGAVTYTVYNSNNTQIATMSTTETELSTSNTLTISQGVNANGSTYVRNIQIL